MRRAVNAAGEPRQDYIARVPEIGGYFLRKPLSVGRCVTGAHDGDRRVIQQSAIASHERAGGGSAVPPVPPGSPGRRARSCARRSVQPAKFGTYVRLWWRDKSALALRALHYFRQFGDACRRRPVTLDQFDEGAGAIDDVRTRRSQSTCSVSERWVGLFSMPLRWRGCRVRLTLAGKPIFASSPSIRRRMFWMVPYPDQYRHRGDELRALRIGEPPHV